MQSTDQFLKEELPYWLKETDADVPDSKNDAQRKMEGVKVSTSVIISFSSCTSSSYQFLNAKVYTVIWKKVSNSLKKSH